VIGGKSYGRCWQLHQGWLPTRWALWSQRPRVIAYMLTIEAVAVLAVVGISLIVPPPTWDQTWRFGLLAACATAHLWSSRGIERRRRDLGAAPHVDLNSIWSIAAVLVLHPLLILSLILVVRIHRWPLARRPPFRFTFSGGSHVLSAMLAAAALYLLNGTGLHAGWYGSPEAVAAVLAACGTYFLAQLVVISGVILLSSSDRRLSRVLGTVDANALEATTICLGAFAGLALAQAPLLLAIMVPVALVVHRTVLIRQLQEATELDPKTAVLNAAGWRRRAEREVVRADRQGQSLGLLLVDIDHFDRRVNKLYGHLAGDAVLRGIAGAITAEIREYDLVGRWNGEEFIVLLPGTDGESTEAAAKRIWAAIAGVAVPVEESTAGTVVIDGLTASIGGCSYPEVASSLEQMLTRADNALFAAKEAGRNRVRVIRRLLQG